MRKNLTLMLFGVLTLLFTFSAGKSALRGDLFSTAVLFSVAVVCMTQVAAYDDETNEEDTEEEHI